MHALTYYVSAYMCNLHSVVILLMIIINHHFFQVLQLEPYLHGTSSVYASVLTFIHTKVRPNLTKLAWGGRGPMITTLLYTLTFFRF